MQYTEVIRAALEAEQDFKEISEKLDSLLLLKLIKKIAFNYENQKQPFQAAHEAIRQFY